MRPTFALDLDLKPVSVNAPATHPHAFAVGDVLWLAYDYRYEGHTVPEGTKFFVADVAEDDGTMWLLAEGDVPALFHAHNMLALSPYVTEDILPHLRAALRCPAVPVLAPKEAPLPASNVRLLGRVVCAAAILTYLLAPAQLSHHTRDQIGHATQSADDMEPVNARGVIIADATG